MNLYPGRSQVLSVVYVSVAVELARTLSVWYNTNIKIWEGTIG